MKYFKSENKRLNAIDAEIRSQKYPSQEELAKLLDVDIRSIARDISFMKKSLHAPIKYSRAKKGYFYDKEFNFTPSTSALNDDESLSILLSNKICHQFLFDTVLYERIRSGMESLHSKLSQNIQDEFKSLVPRIQFAFPEFSFPLRKDLQDTLFSAIKNEQFISLSRIDSKEQEAVLPLMITLFKDDWTLFYLSSEAFFDNYKKLDLQIDHFKVCSLHSIKGIDIFISPEVEKVYAPTVKEGFYEIAQFAGVYLSESDDTELLGFDWHFRFAEHLSGTSGSLLVCYRRSVKPNGTYFYERAQLSENYNQHLDVFKDSPSAPDGKMKIYSYPKYSARRVSL